MPNFNKIRTVNLIGYLPNVLSDVREISAIMGTETTEISAIWNACEACLDDQYIGTATDNGISRREKMLGITPMTGETLNERRNRIIGLYNTDTPYTRKKLVAMLDTICGIGNYTLNVNAANFTVTVMLSLPIKNRKDTVTDLLERILPYNMLFSANLIYNTWGMFGTHTWGNICRTWHDAKEEVIT